MGIYGTLYNEIVNALTFFKNSFETFDQVAQASFVDGFYFPLEPSGLSGMDTLMEQAGKCGSVSSLEKLICLALQDTPFPFLYTYRSSTSTAF